ncbi:efflux RND transporter permease subunit [Afifella aestuarii]|uniref:efflux RND transporter permease subunit n=1 Tax=Afifella aestuarii TaxID=1909496 RepID=UPI000FE35D83|nr:efflux RND transporter permease subunit [Afifella aestuarii]
MILSDISIKRPVLAAVASILIVVFGLAAILSIPIRELPDVDTAVVTVTTSYAGAAPEIVDTDITETIEGAVAGISGVKSISSESRRGRSRTTIEFVIGRDIDEAANDVRSAVARVRGDLPDDVDEPQVVKNDADADPVIRLAVTDPHMSSAQITDYLQRYLVDRLATLDGVANVEIFGERSYAIRIWLNREAMAARNLTVADVEDAIRRNNVELPAGDLESSRRQLAVRVDSRVAGVDAFSNIVVDRIAGFPVRLKDIAKVELGVEDDTTLVRLNGVEAVGLGISRQSQANTIAISRAVAAELERIRPTLPEGMEITVGSDDAVFIQASIREVLIALVISLVLVVLVILAFLLSVRATLVPAVTIPVSLIGCFILISALGFSINVLTLLALILAIGLVVDDAIVVLENIQRRIDEGETPMVAAFLGSRQVTFAVLATSLTLIAVFIPISFLQGQAGRLFTEFGFVMASAVAISTFVALTLCPVLASRLLKRHRHPAGQDDSGRPSRFRRGYEGLLRRALGMPLVVISVALVVAGGGIFLYQELPRELTPKEDRGVIFVPLTTPQGSTTAYTDGEVRVLERELEPLLQGADVRSVYSIVGSWGRPYRAFVLVRLAPWEERERGQAEVQRDIIPAVGKVIGATGFPVTPAGLGLRGSSTPLRVVVGGPDFESVKEWANTLLDKARQNEGLRNAELDFEENQPQADIRIDRERLDDLGVSVQTVAQTLQTMFASREISDWVDRGREYPVILQAREEDRRVPSDIGNIFMRAGDGENLFPLSSVVTVKEAAAAPELRRYNRLPSITLEAALAENYDLGSAIDFIREAAAESLPPEAQIAFAGQSQQYLETSSGVAVTFGLAILIVFLVLAAQFESFVHPLVIMLSVPLAFAGAIYALYFAGLSLNIYSQIGIILLVGLMAKNGILIVEFANQLRDEGMEVREAVIEASILRFRPIIMTVISTVLGAVPLVLASGAGAESRSAIGVVIVGGLMLASLLTLVVTPVLYDLLARFTEPRGAVEKRLAAELPSGGRRT